MKTLIMMLLVGLASTSFAGVIKSGTLQAKSDGKNVTVQWESTDETNVLEYGIERSSTSGGDVILVGTVKAKGMPSTYYFVDQSAFKTTGTMYQYRVRIVSSNYAVSYSDWLTVVHSTSGVRRTWGSIKAMFR